jgi:hypothetical protein
VRFLAEIDADIIQAPGSKNRGRRAVVASA